MIIVLKNRLDLEKYGSECVGKKKKKKRQSQSTFDECLQRCKHKHRS